MNTHDRHDPTVTPSESSTANAQSPSTDVINRAPTRVKRRRAVFIGAILCVLVLVSGAGFYALKVTHSTPTVTLYRATTQLATQDIGGGGLLYPRQQLDISYPIAEHVETVLVKPGDQVSPDSALMQLDPTKLNAQIAQAANDLAAAQVYLNAVSTTTRNPVTIASAQQAYDNAKNRYDSLVAEASSPTLRNGVLISPMSGVVTAVDINSGEAFNAGMTLITIMDESSMIVHMEVPLSNLGQVNVGQTAMVTPSSQSSLSFPGKVASIIPQANADTATFEVWVEVPNPDGLLLPGMSTFVRIEYPLTALAVPRLAVLDLELDPTVFVVRNDQAYVRHVHVVGRSISTIYLDAGISNGDMVVVVGIDSLQNGEKVVVGGIEG